MRRFGNLQRAPHRYATRKGEKMKTCRELVPSTIEGLEVPCSNPVEKDEFCLEHAEVRVSIDEEAGKKKLHVHIVYSE